MVPELSYRLVETMSAMAIFRQSGGALQNALPADLDHRLVIAVGPEPN